MNTHYARIENNVLVYAPKTLVAKSGALILNPKRLAYLQAGYKQIIDTPPAAPVGKTAALTRYDENNDTYLLETMEESQDKIQRTQNV